jgi:hypothetical protein
MIIIVSVCAAPVEQVAEILCFGFSGSAQKRLDMEDLLQSLEG